MTNSKHVSTYLSDHQDSTVIHNHVILNFKREINTATKYTCKFVMLLRHKSYNLYCLKFSLFLAQIHAIFS